MVYKFISIGSVLVIVLGVALATNKLNSYKQLISDLEYSNSDLTNQIDFCNSQIDDLQYQLEECDENLEDVSTDAESLENDNRYIVTGKQIGRAHV